MQPTFVPRAAEAFVNIKKMIDYFKFHYSLTKFFRKRSKTVRFYQNEISKLRKNKAVNDELQSWYAEQRMEVDIIDYEIECLTTSYYMNVARRKFIEIPEWADKEAWVESSLDPNRRVLSNKAISDLRSKIIKYKKERNEQFISLITALTGLAGVVLGILAIYKK